MICFKGLILAPTFTKRSDDEFHRMQKYVDSEVIRHSDPYVPVASHAMRKSGISGTVLGSGVVQYTAPYARRQYYTNAGRGKEGINAQKGTKGLRGKMWFERMKADHRDDILRSVKKR